MNLQMILKSITPFFLLVCLSSSVHSADYNTVRELAEKGDAAAQFDLGTLYDLGEGVEKNYAEAAKWYKKSAEQGEVAAQYNLAIMYDTGEGVEKDIVQAYVWLSAAEIFGYTGAKETSKNFLSRMTPDQIEKGDQAVINLVNSITNSKQ